jgi:hypothetical protein
MSYDLHLVRPRPGQAIEEIAMADDEDGPPAGPPDPAKEAVKRHTADTLLAADPSLRPFVFDYAEIARIRGISLEQARRDHRHIELNDDRAGIQIMLCDDSAYVTVPYWHDGAKANDVFRRILECVRIIARETGFVAYDPQIGEVIDPDIKIAKMVAAYVPMVSQLRDMKREATRPWWKFW